MLQLLVERKIFWICFDIGLKRVSGTIYCNVSIFISINKDHLWLSEFMLHIRVNLVETLKNVARTLENLTTKELTKRAGM